MGNEKRVEVKGFCYWILRVTSRPLSNEIST
ncbi:MAG: hypothetical protein DDT26_02067 [Dehalococcoidia bacterium]|nr:hypothetical protein [Chloroflexota bacterium]